MNRWAHTSGELIRAFLYAAVTATVIVALAYVLGREASAARDQAYFEIHDHRIAAQCYSAELAVGLNRLLEEAGQSPVAVPNTDGLGCAELSPVDPNATPQP